MHFSVMLTDCHTLSRSRPLRHGIRTVIVRSRLPCPGCRQLNYRKLPGSVNLLENFIKKQEVDRDAPAARHFIERPDERSWCAKVLPWWLYVRKTSCFKIIKSR
jgi:hypothetical protein